jgi:hypothetical protein
VPLSTGLLLLLLLEHAAAAATHDTVETTARMESFTETSSSKTLV